MSEVGIGGHDVNLSTCLLEFCVVVSSVFYFSGAVKGECSGHENKNVPLALEGFVGHGDEFAIVESFVFEGLDLRVDQRHGDFLFNWLFEQ
jgi:hypothetical protein